MTIITIGWLSVARRPHALCRCVFLLGLLVSARDGEICAPSSSYRCPTGTS